jgi:hypothetical protein
VISLLRGAKTTKKKVTGTLTNVLGMFNSFIDSSSLLCNIEHVLRQYNRRDIDNNCLAGSTRSWMGYKNPLCRVVPIYYTQKNNGKRNYDKEKYRELILDAAETVLGYFGFDINLYSDKKNVSKRKWWWA